MKESSPLYKHYRYQLSQSELFLDLPLAALDEFLAHCRFETWNKGLHQDSKNASRRFYILLAGRMELLKINPVTGKQIILLILRAGDVYDVLSLLDGKKHDIVPLARDELRLLSAPINQVQEWIAQYPEFNKNLMPYLSKQIRAREALVTDLSLYDASTRLARLILRYTTNDRIGDMTGQNINAPLLHNLPNEVLAQMIGSVRQVVNSHLQTMKREGILHIEDRQLVIDDFAKLQQNAQVLNLSAYTTS